MRPGRAQAARAGTRKPASGCEASLHSFTRKGCGVTSHTRAAPRLPGGYRMKVHKLKVDGQTFILAPDQDIETLQSEILAAAREGAGFVQFVTVGRSQVRALITPYVGVRFEVMERDEDEIAAWEHSPPVIDHFEDL